MRVGQWAFLWAGVWLYVGMGHAQEFRFMEKGKLFTYEKEGVKLSVGGRALFDGADYSRSENVDTTDTDVRDARFGFKLSLGERWQAKAEADFSSDRTNYKDVYIRYKTNENGYLYLGQQKEAFGLERLNSSKNITFMERPLQTALVPNRQIGLNYTTSKDWWTVSAGVYGQAINKDKRESASARVTAKPFMFAERLMHFGLSYSHVRPGGSEPGKAGFETRPETYISGAKFLKTGSIEEVDKCNIMGLEWAGVHNSFHYQAEYTSTDVLRRSGLENYHFEGWYVSGGYFLTGESRPYDNRKGTFSSVKPKGRFFAFELTGRYGELDLDDHSASLFGGKSDTLTVGMNVYMGEYSRFMVNYVLVDNGSFADGSGALIPGDDFAIFQTRYQLVF